MKDQSEQDMDDPYQQFVVNDYKRRVEDPASRAVASTSPSGGGVTAPQRGPTQDAPGTAPRPPPNVPSGSWKIGDVRLNDRAARDVLSEGILLNGILDEDVVREKQVLREVLKKGPNKKAEQALTKLRSEEPTDQVRIKVEGGTEGGKPVSRLGYDPLHMDPFDPFRWSKLKDIVNGGSLDIFATTGKFSMRVNEGGKIKIKQGRLHKDELLGVTLPRLKVAQDNWAREKLVGIDKLFGYHLTPTSLDDDRDQIYYLIGASQNALAHEFFGHLWLMRQHVPFEHGLDPTESALRSGQALTAKQRDALKTLGNWLGTLRAEHGIRDPFGYPFVGSVNQFIEWFCGQSESELKSPTHWTGDSRLNRALELVHDGLVKPGAMQHDADGWPRISGKQLVNWNYLSNNYQALSHSPLKLHDELASLVVGWFKEEFDTKQQKWFISFLDRILYERIPSAVIKMPKGLTKHVRRQIS